MESLILSAFKDYVGPNKEFLTLLGIFFSNVGIAFAFKVRNTKIDGKLELHDDRIKHIDKKSDKALRKSEQALEISRDTKRHFDSFRTRLEEKYGSSQEKHDQEKGTEKVYEVKKG